MPTSFEQIKELADLSAEILNDSTFAQLIEEVSEKIIEAYRNGKKTIFCGNGGSSAEAQHLAAELSGKFNLERKPIPAEACHVNSSFVTAVANDYDFSKIYSRYIEGFGQIGDVLIGLSTSGASANIVEAFKIAHQMGIVTVALTGQSGGELAGLSDYCFKVPSTNVPRIQEIHLLIGHILCGNVEQALFGNEN
ncbi:D-sedoheptulose-7-phosphate isomerase [Maribellus sediminis]|uniref:D-sedoheptulose-7-phosphate isomerase n=1 Tax=Maribellus sediminis TaxID=2696285 RepID=UPI0014313541|nr:SIS domain-containing protein [Maribellus sediminis]